MNLFEAGVLSGIPAGAAIGGAAGKAHGVGAAAGAVAGAASGALAGWAYAWAVLLLTSAIGVLWRAARRRPVKPPTDAEMGRMTPIAIRGVFCGAMGSTICWLVSDWALAVLAAAAAAVAASSLAVARAARDDAA